MIIWNTQIDALFQATGVPLFNIDINNWAFKKSDALIIINDLLLSKIPILGGDVFVKCENKIYHSYDSWYFNRITDVSFDEYLQKSIETARSFVLNYKEIDRKTLPLFAIVPDV